MFIILWAWINDCDLSTPDYVSSRPREGEASRIICNDSSDSWSDLNNFSVFRVNFCNVRNAQGSELPRWLIASR